MHYMPTLLTEIKCFSNYFRTLVTLMAGRSARGSAPAGRRARRGATGRRRNAARPELDWPGSRALLARFGLALAAQDPQDAQARLGKSLCAGLDAYRVARKARTGDQGRFAAFVAGLTEALAESDQRALVTESLSPLQQRALRLAAEDHG
jgi:hypothetical protein